MNEIDLIPPDYRLLLIKMKHIKQFAIVLSALLLLTTGGYATLSYVTQNLKTETSLLQKQHAFTTQQRNSLIQIQKEKSILQQQWKALQELRSGAEVKAMFESIDSIIPEDLWFLSWSFQRAGIVEIKPKKETNGYFIIVPKNGSTKKPTGTLLQTNMSIIGQARDHAALSSFVHRLFKQPEIQDVRIVKTSLRRYSTISVVDFDLAVTANTRLREN